MGLSELTLERNKQPGDRPSKHLGIARLGCPCCAGRWVVALGTEAEDRAGHKTSSIDCWMDRSWVSCNRGKPAFHFLLRRLAVHRYSTSETQPWRSLPVPCSSFTVD